MPSLSSELDRALEGASHLVALSPADATLVSWLEWREGIATESARHRRATTVERREILVRVREAGRSGAARSDSAEAGSLQNALRCALVAARLAPPTPDWEPPAAAASASAGDLADPEIVGLGAERAQQILQPLANRRSALELRWRASRLAVASSFAAPRSAELTDVTFEARTGQRPGSGFAARTAATLAACAIGETVARATALEPPAVEYALPAADQPLVLSAEAAIVVLSRFARSLLSAGRRLERGAPFAIFLAPVLALVDEPLAEELPRQPFDFDGTPKSRRVFVDQGRILATASDLDLAPRLGERTSGHGLGADDAWPLHLVMKPGPRQEGELLRDAAGGIRIGAIERLAIEPGEELRFRALARSVRRISSDGSLGAGLPPFVWSSSLVELFSRLEQVATVPELWRPDEAPFGALSAPAALVAPCGQMRSALFGRSQRS